MFAPERLSRKYHRRRTSSTTKYISKPLQTPAFVLSSSQVPTKFILSTLGPYAKYSSCLYPTGKESLAQAETLMLESYCEKARLRDGQEVLDLGCGVYITQSLRTTALIYFRMGKSVAIFSPGKYLLQVPVQSPLNKLRNIPTLVSSVSPTPRLKRRTSMRLLKPVV